jgi:hypothetical protein
MILAKHKIANVTLPYTFSIRDFGETLAPIHTIIGTPTATEGGSYVTIGDIQGSGTTNYFNVTVTEATNEMIQIEIPAYHTVLNRNEDPTPKLKFYIVAD